MKKRGLALWDIFEKAEREGSADNKISRGVPNKINELLDKKEALFQSCSTAKNVMKTSGAIKNFGKGRIFPN